MNRSRAHAWDDDEDLRAKAAAERQKSAGRKPNGLDHDRRIELVPFEKMVPRLTGLSLVHGVLALEQTSVIFGGSGFGKTFLALSIGLHVADGSEWLGRRVTRGTVVYIAAEAGRMIFNRVIAWRIHHGMQPKKMPFYAVPMQLDLCNDDVDMNELIEGVRKMCGDETVLIIVDTVARVMPGANENSPEGMGALIGSADRLRDEFGCHVMLIHHTGKDPGKGARGHSSLHAAVDTEIFVDRKEGDKVSTAKVLKQRDSEAGLQLHFALRPVTIGKNEDIDDEVTSCIVELADEGEVTRLATEAAKSKMPRAQRVALDALKTAIMEEGQEPPTGKEFPHDGRCVKDGVWRQYCYDAGISDGNAHAQQAAFKRASVCLFEEGRVEGCGGWVWPL
jgi:hypothetical protein